MGIIDLTGRTALVTGAAQGVGRAIAHSLARAGADLVLHSLMADEAAAETKVACLEFGRAVELICGDLAGGAEAATIAGEAAVAVNPNIDILINNAGTYIDKPFLEMDERTFLTTMQLNVFAGFFLTQFFSRRWVAAQQDGRVLFTGSINGRLAESVHSAYDTSKGAVESMVRTLCVELAPRGIRVNGMAPGLVYTPLTAAALDNPEFRRWMELHTPNRQVPGAEVCGDTAAFLVSDAATHIHGQMLLVDGGMSIWQQPDLPTG